MESRRKAGGWRCQDRCYGTLLHPRCPDQTTGNSGNASRTQRLYETGVQLYCTCHSFDPPMDWQVGKVRWLGHASLAMTSFASSRWLARLTLAGKQPQQQTSAAQPPPPTTALHFTSSTLARHTHTHDHCIVCLQPSRHTSPPSPSWQSTMASSCLA